MAKQVVQMDYSVIADVSRGFASARGILKNVSKVLSALVKILVGSAFLSFGTNLALARYLRNVNNKIKHLANVCGEFSGDLAQAIEDHKRGEVKGKRYFGEGVRR